MAPKHALLPCLFVVAGVLADLNQVQVSPIVSDTPQAKLLVEGIKKQILAQPPRADKRLSRNGQRLDTGEPNPLTSSASSQRLNEYWGYNCYWTMQRFNTTADEIEINIVANENQALVSGSTAPPLAIKSITAVVDTTISGWKVGSLQWQEWTGSINLDLPYLKPSATFKKSATDSEEISGGKDTKDEIREEINQERICPPNTACSIQAWTFTSKLRGNCPLVPMVDPKCFANARGRKDDPANKPLIDLLNQNKWMRDNISLAAMNEQNANWTLLSTHFFDMTRKDGSPAGKVQPAKEVDEIFLPADDFIINYKENPACELLKSPVYRTDGSAQRVHVMIEKPVNSLSKRMMRRAGEDGQPETAVKVTILQDLVW